VTLSGEKRADDGADVVNLTIRGGDQKGLVDVRTDPPTGDGRLRRQVESCPDSITIDRELWLGGRADHQVLRTAVQAAAQVISREAGLEAEFDARAAPGERNAARMWLTKASM
jgi:hypothetical protein